MYGRICRQHAHERATHSAPRTLIILRRSTRPASCVEPRCQHVIANCSSWQQSNMHRSSPDKSRPVVRSVPSRARAARCLQIPWQIAVKYGRGSEV
eukprot:scaffold1741_cov262-Pinguiococcus_pyrenoidosus.AAC.16